MLHTSELRHQTRQNYADLARLRDEDHRKDGVQGQPNLKLWVGVQGDSHHYEASPAPMKAGVLGIFFGMKNHLGMGHMES